MKGRRPPGTPPVGFLGVWVAPIRAGFYPPAGGNRAVAVAGRSAIEPQSGAAAHPGKAHAAAAEARGDHLAFDTAGGFATIGESVHGIRQPTYTGVARNLQGACDHEPAFEASAPNLHSGHLVGGSRAGDGPAGRGVDEYQAVGGGMGGVEDDSALIVGAARAGQSLEGEEVGGFEDRKSVV